MLYDGENIFARILRGEIPCQKVYEDRYALAFHDIHPRAPIHVLVIPKGRHASLLDFSQHASPESKAGFLGAIGKVIEQLGLKDKGCRMISNHGADAGQEVPHFHVHLLGGRPLGPMLTPPNNLNEGFPQ